MLVKELLVIWHAVVIVLYEAVDLHYYVVDRLLLCNVDGLVVHKTESVDYPNEGLVEFEELIVEKFLLRVVVPQLAQNVSAALSIRELF